MDAYQILEKVKESEVTPPEVWYLATLALTGILIVFIGVLIFLIKGFFVDLKETLTSLKNNIDWLTKLVTAHEVDMKNVKEDINDLKRRPRR